MRCLGMGADHRGRARQIGPPLSGASVPGGGDGLRAEPVRAAAALRTKKQSVRAVPQPGLGGAAGSAVLPAGLVPEEPVP